VKKLIALFAFSALGSMTAFAAEFNGVISDSMCGAKHLDASDKSMACAQKCVKGGMAPVFVSAADNKVYKIDAASVAKVTPHVGHKVMITGTMDGDTLKVDSIKM
jgi:hypothetical protein